MNEGRKLETIYTSFGRRLVGSVKCGTFPTATAQLSEEIRSAFINRQGKTMDDIREKRSGSLGSE